MENGDGLWTLDGLTAAVAAVLAEGYEGASSGRVRDFPDRRTIRYYTTLGLIDRPASMRGRTALYDRKHLLQIVAIKKLQARGRTLSEIQQVLAGRPLSELALIADAPVPPEPEAGPSRADRDFWKQAPTPPDAADVPDAEEDRPRVLIGIPMHPDVTLLLSPSRSLDDDDLEAIRATSTELLRTLSRRHLIDLSEGGEHP